MKSVQNQRRCGPEVCVLYLSLRSMKQKNWSSWSPRHQLSRRDINFSLRDTLTILNAEQKLSEPMPKISVTFVLDAGVQWERMKARKNWNWSYTNGSVSCLIFYPVFVVVRLGKGFVTTWLHCYTPWLITSVGFDGYTTTSQLHFLPTTMAQTKGHGYKARVNPEGNG